VDDVGRYLDRVAGAVGEGDDALEPSPAPGRILVAEDAAAVRELLCDYLRSQGHTAVPARDGAEALQLCDDGDFDLVMTDIEMPVASGFELLERLRGHARLRDVPVIVLSGHAALDGIAHCLKLGAEDFLPKPFNRVILKARVDACLEKRRLRQRSEQERLRYTDLLNAILPGPVVRELVETDGVQPRRRDGVAVLFADIVGFTTYCDRRQSCPEVVVQHLRRLFEAWEADAIALGVQKIKTIGDAFMAAAGLLEDAANPVDDCVELGLRMIRFTRKLGDEDGTNLGFNLRVGVHTGTVVSGVLGRRQSLFDLWGDAVNIAARLESHGRPGCVNLSALAWARVRDRFAGATSSVLPLKGKPGMSEVIHLDPDAVTCLH
jgi:class 3 adenylate cyclase